MSVTLWTSVALDFWTYEPGHGHNDKFTELKSGSLDALIR